MHSATQIIAQRAPPAIRTKTRWQPYHTMPANAVRSPTVAIHNTPASFVQLPHDSRPSDLDTKESIHPQPSPVPPVQTTPSSSLQRDATKHKFAAGLIDQAVNILTEIWRPQDVPDVFRAPSKGSSLNSVLGHAAPLTSNQPFCHTPTPSNSQPSTSALVAHAHASFASAASQVPLASGNSDLLPMKTFVHEVLKRSRTSGNILQAALCYLEAIRPKVPEILQQERMGIRESFQSDDRVLPATEVELALEEKFAALEDSLSTTVNMEQQEEDFDETKTVRVTDNNNPDGMQHDLSDAASISSLIAEPCAPVNALQMPKHRKSLPSPLLCPRRAFLASLILASKFFQDKCYSNRAWAKLSGLPPREIGRCERALGQALEWRLWVGKCAAPSPARTLARSQSEHFVSSGSQSAPFVSNNKPMRRSSTLPADVFQQKMPASSFITTTATYNVEFASGSTSLDCRSDIAAQPTWATSREVQSQLPTKTDSTPSPDLPGLTYSPTSTDSSGDRTIQVSSFEDSAFPSTAAIQPWIECQQLPADDVFGLKGNYKASIFGKSYAIQRAVSVAVTEPEMSPCRPEMGYTWHLDNRYITLESTNVH